MCRCEYIQCPILCYIEYVQNARMYNSNIIGYVSRRFQKSRHADVKDTYIIWFYMARVVYND